MKKTAFDLTHERKGTYKPDGTLYPILCQRLVPGDVFKGNTEVFGRMVPLVGPMMHRFDVYIHYFAVPDRLVWDNFEKFRSPEFTGLIPPEPIVYPAFGIRHDSYNNNGAVPHWRLGVGSLADHMGLQLTPNIVVPNDADSDVKFSSLPFRSYQLIWNYHYRDVDLQEPINVLKTDGYDNDSGQFQFEFLKRNWEKDYFTSARPFAQKGAPVRVSTTTLSTENEFGDWERQSGAIVIDNNEYINKCFYHQVSLIKL